MLKFLVALTLVGSVSNTYGRIGIKVSSDGGIGKVYKISPAARAGLQRGDIILEADGHKGTKYIDGIAGTEATLKVFRKNRGLFRVVVPRVSKREVHD
jgi:C-terminal processing protease CtpA/Prc